MKENRLVQGWGNTCPQCDHDDATVKTEHTNPIGYINTGDKAVCNYCGLEGEVDSDGDAAWITWQEPEDKQTDLYHASVINVEVVQFTGSTTSGNAIQYWVEKGEYINRSINTRDLRVYAFDLPNGDKLVMQPQDYVIKLSDKNFVAVSPNVFNKLFNKVG